MPLRGPGAPALPTDNTTTDDAAPVRLTGLRGPSAASAPVEPSESSTGSFAIPALIGGAALGGAAMLAHNPNVPNVLRKGLEYANAARQQLMLSGLAPLKSLLGNVGAAVAESAESRSLTPLKEFLSMDTVRDAVNEYKNAPSAAQGVNIPGPMPGRIMGAIDQATQKALQRAGLTPNESAHAVFQTPLGDNFGRFGEVFEDNPIADYLIPFRRTPFNQLAEGLRTMSGPNRDLPVLAGYMGTGAAHGYATADDKYPMSLPLAVAGSAKYGVPYSIGAIAGRVLAGKKDGGNAASGITPVSEYGITQSVESPLAPFEEPAAIKALKQLLGR